MFLGITLLIFIPIFKTNSLIFPYAINEFDICKTYPDTWKIIKKVYIITAFISYSLLIYRFLIKTNFWKKSLNIFQLRNILLNNT